MKKTTWHYLVDVILFISIFGLIIIGIIMAFFTSSGPQVDEASKYFLNLHRHQWGDIHFYFSIVFILFLIIHLILEWKWIKGKTRKLFGNVWFLAFTAAFLVIILFLSWYFSPKDFDMYEGYGKGRGKEYVNIKGFNQTQIKGQNMIIITGRISLNDIEEKTGISSRKIADKLGLPGDISLNERLGLLRKRYLFNMQDVRDVVSSLLKEKKHEQQKEVKKWKNN